MWSHRHALVHSFIKSLWPSIAKRSQLSASLYLTFLFLLKHWFPLHFISEVSSSLPWKAVLVCFNDFYFSSWPPNATGFPGSVLVPHLCSTNTPGRSHPISDLKKKKHSQMLDNPNVSPTRLPETPNLPTSPAYLEYRKHYPSRCFPHVCSWQFKLSQTPNFKFYFSLSYQYQK